MTDVGTLNEWSKTYTDFSKAYLLAQAMQIEHLATVTGLGLYNSNWAVFMAKNITDWRDKKDIEHSGNIDSTLFVDSMVDKAKDAQKNEREVLKHLN